MNDPVRIRRANSRIGSIACLGLILILASGATAEEGNDPQLAPLLESVAQGNSRLLPSDEALLSRHPTQAVRAILKGWKGRDPGMFSYLVRNIIGKLPASDRESLVSGLLSFASQGDGIAIEALSTYKDPRVREMVRRVALDEKMPDGIRASAVEAYATQTCGYDANFHIDQAAVEKERPFFERVATEPSMAGLRAAAYIKGFYKDDSYERRLKEMQTSRYDSVDQAGAALRSSKQWQRDKAVKELTQDGQTALPILLDAYPSADAYLQSNIYGAIHKILEQSRNQDVVSLQIVVKAMERGGATRPHLVGFLRQLNDLPQTQKVIADLAEKDRDVDVRTAAISELGEPWGKQYDEKLKQILTDPHAQLRAMAARSLGRHGDASGKGVFIDVLKTIKRLGHSPSTPQEKADSLALSTSIEGLGEIGGVEDIPVLEAFKADQSTATIRNTEVYYADQSARRIKIRSLTDKAAKVRWLEGEWESSCNAEISGQLDALLDDREIAEFCLDVLKRGTSKQCAQDKARNYLIDHNWIAKEDRFEPAEKLKLNEQSAYSGTGAWFWHLLKKYGPPPPSSN